MGNTIRLMNIVFLFVVTIVDGVGVNAAGKKTGPSTDRWEFCERYADQKACYKGFDDKDPLVMALFESRKMIDKEVPELAQELTNAEAEFKQTLDDLTAALMSDGTYRYVRTPNRDSIQEKARGFFFKRHDITFMAIPHEIYLGTVFRSALNFKKYNLILFDLKKWKTATIRSRRLLVLTELGGLFTEESEDQRYKSAVVMLTKAQSALDDTEYRRSFEVNGRTPPLRGVYFLNPALDEITAFDLTNNLRNGKFFIDQSSPENDATGYLFFNISHPIFQPHVCRQQTATQPYIGAVARITSGMMRIDPTSLEICQIFMSRKENVRLRLIHKNNLVTMCIPEFR